MPTLDVSELGKVMARLRIDRITRLELRHRWIFGDEFIAFVVTDDHSCRNEILIPRPALGELLQGLSHF